MVIGQIAAETHGHVGADLAGLCQEAALQQIREKVGHVDIQLGDVDEHILNSLAISNDNFRVSLLPPFTLLSLPRTVLLPPLWRPVGILRKGLITGKFCCFLLRTAVGREFDGFLGPFMDYIATDVDVAPSNPAPSNHVLFWLQLSVFRASKYSKYSKYSTLFILFCVFYSKICVFKIVIPNV